MDAMDAMDAMGKMPAMEAKTGRARVRVPFAFLFVFLLLIVTRTATVSHSAASGGAAAVEAGRPPETVVLLHGLFRTARSMAAMERALAAAGFEVINVGYPSLEQPIELHARTVGEILAACCDDGRTVHFVTHSMGGIIARYYLGSAPAGLRGRVVMLSPPNQGSEVIDVLAASGLLGRAAGPSATQLETGSNGLPARLGPVRFELGVIAGDRTINPVFSWLIPGDDDGAVSVESARVEGMADFIVLPFTHTFIMNAGEVHRQTVHFLREGRFDHGAAIEAAGD